MRVVCLLLAGLVPAPAAALRLAVTGANGYLGNEIVCRAFEQGHSVRAVLRSTKGCTLPPEVEVMQVEDLSDPAAAREAADGVDAVIHTASVFRKCDDWEAELVGPNIALAEQMVCACAAAGARLVLTSSMAAVRGGGQRPSSGRNWYTAEDWNSVSRRDGPGFEPYQFSKMESERRAWELSREIGGELVTLCPSMIFGPPRCSSCEAFSVQMVRSWVEGDRPIESRLVADVRDVAQAHINAAALPGVAHKRFIVSCEARVPAREILQEVNARLGADVAASRNIRCDEDFDGGAIPIGEREVDAAALRAELGVECRSTSETIADMAEALLA
eukprot:scaffold243338_cov31-Tisochrysis_lutea.AAC.3